MFSAGDYNTTETVHLPFNTFTSDDPSASVTVTDLVAGDIEIHKDGSTTQRASDNGVTVSIDFDTVTGGHMVHIDLSDNSDASYYADGSRYQVRLEGITVDGATLNVWIGTFSIGCTLRPATAGRTLVVESDGVAHADVKEWLGVAPLALSSQQVQAIVPNTQKVDVETIKTQAVTCGAGVTVGVYVGSTAAAAVASDVTTAHSTTDGLVNGLNDFDPANDAVASVTLVDTTTAVSNRVTADMTYIHGSALTEGTGGYLAAAFVKLFDVATPLLVASDVMRGTDSGALAATALSTAIWTAARAGYIDSLQNHIAQTGDGYAVLTSGVVGLAVIDGIVDGIKAVTDVLLGKLADGTVQVGTVRDGAIGADAVADIFSTAAIAEAYAADGAAGTPAQLLYLILQNICEFAVNSTTKTVKKLDGSTTAGTYTLDDDTTPTSITRSG